MGQVEITLSLPEFDLAVNTARLRIIASASRRNNPATTYERTLTRRITEEVIGACGELAVGKWANEFFVPSVNTYHRVPDCLGNVEVRATDHPDGCLIVRDNDDGERQYVLAIVQAPLVRLVGWMTGEDAKRDQFKRNPNNYRDAWFVPQGNLMPMPSLRGASL